MSASNTLQPLKIVYNYFIVSNAQAIVFVFMDFKAKDKEYCKKVGQARELFKELEFKKINIYTDLSKGQMIEKLDMLQI